MQCQIRELFTNPEFTLADDDIFYRIVVSYAPNLKANENGDDKLTSLAIIDPDGSSLENQKQYTNNYFKYKSEAMKVANQIADEIGINRPYSDDEIQKCELEEEIRRNECNATNTPETETSESD